MTRSRLLAATTAATLALLTLSTGAAAEQPLAPTAAVQGTAPPRVDWGTCDSPWLREVRAQCGVVQAPLDYDDPTGPTVELAVSRVRHTTPSSQGVMLVNPGGPGGSGLDFAVLGRLMPRDSGASYDWVGFDPRGAGASRPRLSCRPRYMHADRPPYVPTGPGTVRAWLQRSAHYAAGCAKHGALLDHMKTTDLARDMDRIRQALGVERIGFYGYSYGSYLGQVYATLFPANLGPMVLDSNIDPAKVWYQANLDQIPAFERAFGVYFRWVAQHRRTYHLGRTGAAVARHYLAQRHVLRKRPANGVLGPSELDDAMLPAAYGELFWPVLTEALSAWVNDRDPRPLIGLWRTFDTPGDDNAYAGYLAVTCTDAPVPTEWSTWAADARRLHRANPMVTWNSTWSHAPCLRWPAPPGTPVTVQDHGGSVLLLGQSLDAPTPYAHSLAVREIFSGARLVGIRGGITHGSSPDLAGPCARAWLAKYLDRGALPDRLPGSRADVVCQAPPPPRPQAGGRSTESPTAASLMPLLRITLGGAGS